MTLGTSRVYVASRLDTSGWEDAQTGEARASVEFVVDDLILLDRLTPARAPEEAQDAREPQSQPNSPVSTTRPSAQHTIRRPPQPVQLRDTAAQPSKRRRNDR